jgi:membrane protease YdiL (CAAX protease family)
MSNVSSDEPKPNTEVAAKVPWGPKAAITVSIVAFVLAQIVTATVLYALQAAGLFGSQAEDWLSSTEGQFVFVLVSEALIVLVLWLFLRRRGAHLRQLGFNRRPGWGDVGQALLGFVGYFGLLVVAVALLRAITSIDFDQRQELGFDNVVTAGGIAMAFISLVLLPPLVEETVFRGFLFGGLRKKINFWWAALLTSLIFAAPHLLASSQGFLWAAGVDTLLLSLVLCYLREKTGALWAPIMVHAIKNSIAFVFYIGLIS